MLTAKRPAGVEPEVTLWNPHEVRKWGFHPGFGIKGTRHQKSRTGISNTRKRTLKKKEFFIAGILSIMIWFSKDNNRQCNLKFSFSKHSTKYYINCGELMRKISTCSIPLHFWTQSSLDILPVSNPCLKHCLRSTATLAVTLNALHSLLPVDSVGQDRQSISSNSIVEIIKIVIIFDSNVKFSRTETHGI